MADLAKRKKIRDGHRGIVTRKLAEAEKLLEEVEGGAIADEVLVAQLRLSLKEKLEALKRKDEEVVDLIDDGDEVIREIEDADAFNENVSNVLVALGRIADVQGASKKSQSTRAKLPKLNLPVFSGDVTEWMTFWDSYETAVHQNSELSDVEKFTYLKTLVTRTAKESIAGLTLTSANYKEAVRLLTDRFGKKERIISRHMEALLNLESVTWQGNTTGLRSLFDKIETHTRELVALGVAPEAYNSLLPSLLMKKLPHELCLAISRRIPEDEWNLERIMKELSDELRARERAVSERKKTSEEHRSHNKGASFKPTSTALHSRVYSCHYCEGNHESESCLKVAKLEDRRQFIRDSGRCFVCLRKGHVSRNCRAGGKCKHCQGRHHNSICVKLSGEKSEGTRESDQRKGALDPKAEPFKSMSLLTDSSGLILLQTAKAFVEGPSCENRKELRLIFDSGSQRSYITERAKGALCLRVSGKRDVNITTFGANESKGFTCEVVRVNVETREGKRVAMKLLTVPIICESLTGVSLSQCVQNYEHLQGLNLADEINEGESVEFDILVGLDYYWEFVTGEILQGRKGPTAVYSSLGWLLSGPVVSKPTALITHVLTTVSKEKSSLEDQLCKFWELEALGIREGESTVYDQFSSQVKFDGNRYEVSLPWKDTALEIPNNYELSLRRLTSLMKRLKHDPKLLVEYDKVIQDQVNNGIVEIVENPKEADGDKIHYLSHHAIIRQDKETTKVRVVYDASAKDKGPSLNECLHVGPKFGQGIFELLLRFRMHAHAFTADVEKAFLMIAIEKSDRDALRFLWVKDIWKPNYEVIVLRFARVTFGVAPSPFLLNATLRYHIERYRESHPVIVEKLVRSMYVDDVVSGARTAEEVLKLFEDFKHILKEGGFNLRKFVSSQGDAGNTPNSSGELSKVLGINWNLSTDEIVMDLKPIVDEANVFNPTKRHIVSIVSKVYPIGLLSPVTVKLKIFLQELHCLKIGWDEQISDSMRKKWTDIVNSIKDSEPILINRHYFRDTRNEKVEVTLCGFCDASTRAYAAVIYILCITDDGQKRIAFVTSKTRVSPLKEHSIPRLELLAALLLARLMKSVSVALRDDIELKDPVCYTDSLVVLYWIRGVGRSWKPFVENRVREIRSLVPFVCWKHCPGEMNPADIPSRGQTMEEMKSDNLWLKGPRWLVEREELNEVDLGVPEECVSELRADERRECGLLVGNNVIARLINIEKYSNLEKLLRVTAYVFQFIIFLRKKVSGENLSEGEFSSCIAKGELFWVKEVQSTLYEGVRFENERKQLQLFEDSNGVWRCGGRIVNANIPYGTKYPILIPGEHYFTKLIILRCHERVFHNGVRETLAEVRAKYWIMRGRSVIRKILRQCVVCRKTEGQHYSAPDPPPLPAFRVSENPPFTYIGVDFAGPLYIKGGLRTRRAKFGFVSTRAA